MNEQIDIPAKLYEDEVVRYFADRYHTSTENVVRCFLVQDGICPEQENESITFRLEENEMEIMRGLIGEGHSLKSVINDSFTGCQRMDRIIESLCPISIAI